MASSSSDFPITSTRGVHSSCFWLVVTVNSPRARDLCREHNFTKRWNTVNPFRVCTVSQTLLSSTCSWWLSATWLLSMSSVSCLLSLQAQPIRAVFSGTLFPNHQDWDANSIFITVLTSFDMDLPHHLHLPECNGLCQSVSPSDKACVSHWWSWDLARSEILAPHSGYWMATDKRRDHTTSNSLEAGNTSQSQSSPLLLVGKNEVRPVKWKWLPWC